VRLPEPPKALKLRYVSWKCTHSWAALDAITFRAAAELACTCCLHERKRELLVIVMVVKNLVIGISKGAVGRGLESGHEDRFQNVINGEVVEVAQSVASFIHFSKVDVDIALGIAVPSHHAGHFASEEGGLHSLVLKREIIKKGFPDVLRAQLLGGCVGVEDGDGVGELRPKMSKAPIHCVFAKVTFMCVQSHPSGLLGVVDGEVIGGDECTAECTAGQNPAVLNAEGLEKAPDVANILVTLDHAVDK
jgi:hypothetical protein